MMGYAFHDSNIYLFCNDLVLYELAITTCKMELNGRMCCLEER